jgi:hypothetical protein
VSVASSDGVDLYYEPVVGEVSLTVLTGLRLEAPVEESDPFGWCIPGSARRPRTRTTSAWGGADGRSLYVTALSSVYRITL